MGSHKIESKKKQKKPLDRYLNALEKLETSLREISGAVKERKDILEVKRYIDVLNEARADWTRDLGGLGLEIPNAEPPKVRGIPEEALLKMVNLCESGILQAKNKLTTA